MKVQFTAVFRRFPEGYAAFVEESPGANTQGATLEEARANLERAPTDVGGYGVSDDQYAP